jgi:hypothetical protein
MNFRMAAAGMILQTTSDLFRHASAGRQCFDAGSNALV